MKTNGHRGQAGDERVEKVFLLDVWFIGRADDGTEYSALSDLNSNMISLQGIFNDGFK